MSPKSSPNAKDGMVVRITAEDVARLRGETLLDDRTIRRWALGNRVNRASRTLLIRAAHKLRIGASS